MAVFLSPVGGAAAQFFTNTGAVLTGGKLFSYAAGTTTPLATYTTSTGNVARTNPIVLDAAGRVQYQADYRQADAGKQSISVPTSNLTAGNYICLIRTGSGAGFATQLAVVH